MATPTERLTTRTQEFLAEPVTLAVRVEIGPATKLAKYRVVTRLLAFFTPIAFPILMALRVIRGTRDKRATEHKHGILAFLPEEGRVLLAANPFRPSRPIEVMHRFPEATPLEPDVGLMEEYAVAQLTLDGQVFVVNDIDFRVLLRTVENGLIPSVSIGSKLDQLRSDPFSRWASGEPEDFVKK